MHDIITGADFKEMLLFGTASVTAAKQSINDLNVFPVPDGDTGTNMSLTIQTAAAELRKIEPATVDQAASVTASALLRGARGNSGVILSLLFRGMSKYLKGCETADGCAFAAAMQEGVATAYNAVMKPAEGTILTVSRLAADRAMDAAEENNSVEYVLEQALIQGEKTLKDTVNMNPVLKRAGVIDAGGKGFVTIFGGMLSCLRGERIAEPGEEAPAVRAKADFESLGDQDITFTYDTVFIVRKTVQRDLAPYRAYLETIGDSIVIGEDDEAFKVHVHTDTPGDALNAAQQYGTLEIAKIENMRMQQEDLAAGKKTITADDLEDEDDMPSAANAPEDEPEKAIGFLSVCAGDGLAELFRDLGVDGIISGGQTMNP
ncbi:MAG: DAK2 domain-containing protein, partial [Oscillospiraceae bacterium]|nr:DAK2 domain-containing protein [Oscillospiraceae bacterium]